MGNTARYGYIFLLKLILNQHCLTFMERHNNLEEEGTDFAKLKNKKQSYVRTLKSVHHLKIPYTRQLKRLKSKGLCILQGSLQFLGLHTTAKTIAKQVWKVLKKSPI